jgi:hypothetical protein
MMIRAANLLAEARRIPGVAGQSDAHPDWAAVAARIRDEATVIEALDRLLPSRTRSPRRWQGGPSPPMGLRWSPVLPRSGWSMTGIC